MNRRRTVVTLAIVLSIAAGAFWLVGNSRAGTETPEYRVVRTDGAFELREYPALTVAATPMDGADMDGSFMRLFRFITGRNDSEQKIAMTTPVLIDTAVGKRTMSFIMPAKTVANGVPKPAGERVTVSQLPGGRWAVLRFGGPRTAEREAQVIAGLSEWLRTQKLTAEGAPRIAYYDPPWTPQFLRRNEVMVPVE